MKPYAKLRGRMAELEITGEALANYLGRCKAHVSTRMNLRYSWTVDEVYKILDFLEIPVEEIFTYFPPNGGLPQKEVKKKCGSC